MSTARGIQPEVSEKAAALLGYLVTLADGKGEVAVTRKKLATALGASVPTVTRALRELKELGLITVVTEGGGRGQATRYRITAIAREAVPTDQGTGGSHYPSAGASTGGSVGKRCHGDPLREPDRGLESVHSCGVEFGQTMVMGALGLLEGVSQAWKRVPTWARVVLGGGPLGAVGALIGRLHGGKIGTLLGGATGALAGALLAALVPSESKSPPREPPAGCPDRPSEPMSQNDPIWAIVNSTTNR